MRTGARPTRSGTRSARHRSARYTRSRAPGVVCHAQHAAAGARPLPAHTAAALCGVRRAPATQRRAR
eukprot:scaffold90975_cov35-Phaeocystis_antarctica.AAC.2